MDRDEDVDVVLPDEDHLAAEGYRFYSVEALEFAEASMQAFFDVLAMSDPLGWQDQSG